MEVAAPAGRLRETPTASCDDESLLRVTGAVPTVKAEVAPRVGNEQKWSGSLREKSDALERGRPPRGPRTRRARLRGLPVLPLVFRRRSRHITFVGAATASLSPGKASRAWRIVATALKVTFPRAASSLVNV